jgi:hypothetical protein
MTSLHVAGGWPRRAPVVVARSGGSSWKVTKGGSTGDSDLGAMRMRAEELHSPMRGCGNDSVLFDITPSRAKPIAQNLRRICAPPATTAVIAARMQK